MDNVDHLDLQDLLDLVENLVNRDDQVCVTRSKNCTCLNLYINLIC